MQEKQGSVRIDGWMVALLLLVFIAGIWVARSWFVEKDKAGPTEQSEILLEKIRQVSKLVTIEGDFVEYYNYENRPSFYNSYSWLTDQFKKTVQLRVKAKVLVASLTISLNVAPSSSISLISGYLAMMEKTSATPPNVKATG